MQTRSGHSRWRPSQLILVLDGPQHERARSPRDTGQMTGSRRGVACMAVALLGAGCFGSDVPLGPPERGAIDKTLLGTWRCTDPAQSPDKSAALRVIPFDKHQYYAERRESDDIERYRAYSTPIRGETLLNVEDLSFRMRGPEWVFLRAKRGSDGHLRLSFVKEDSLKGLDPATAVRAIKRRVGDDSLYEDLAVCTIE